MFQAKKNYKFKGTAKTISTFMYIVCIIFTILIHVKFKWLYLLTEFAYINGLKKAKIKLLLPIKITFKNFILSIFVALLLSSFRKSQFKKGKRSKKININNIQKAIGKKKQGKSLSKLEVINNELAYSKSYKICKFYIKT